MRRELELWHYGDRGDPGARFRAANFAYLSWRVGHDLAVGYYPEVGEYEVYRDACIKHFGNTKIIDELELFDLIAAQFSDPPSSGIGIRHSTNLDPRGPRAICNHAAS